MELQPRWSVETSRLEQLRENARRRTALRKDREGIQKLKHEQRGSAEATQQHGDHRSPTHTRPLARAVVSGDARTHKEGHDSRVARRRREELAGSRRGSGQTAQPRSPDRYGDRVAAAPPLVRHTQTPRGSSAGPDVPMGDRWREGGAAAANDSDSEDLHQAPTHGPASPQFLFVIILYFFVLYLLSHFIKSFR